MKKPQSSLRRSVLLSMPLYLALAATLPAAAMAQDLSGVVSFDIPSQPLSRALIKFSEQARLQVLVESSLLDNQIAPPIRSNDSPIRVLGQLLAQTDLTYEILNDNTIAITSRSKSGASGASLNQGDSALQLAMLGGDSTANRSYQSDPSSGTGGSLPAQGRPAIEEVIVSARKREESLLEVPISLQAFTATDIQERGFQFLGDIVTFTPGMNFQNMGNSQPGRYNTGIRFRGLEGAQSTPSNQTGALFVDGVFILGGAGSIPLNDLARVEVIKGPQAAYFGRGTFGGAINYVTVDPGEEFSGNLTAQYSPTFGSNAFRLSVDGPITESLSGRLTVASTTQGAMFTATDGGELGEERTDTITGTLLFQPNDRLRIKVRSLYGEDDDGPSSTTYVPFRFVGNCLAGTPLSLNTTSGQVDTTLGQRYQCGAVPNYRVSNNTTFYTVENANGVFDTRDVILGNSLGLPDFGSPSLDGFGLRTDFHVHSLVADYAVTDTLDVSMILGYNDRSTSHIRDGDGYDSPGWINLGFMDLQAQSAELRLNYSGNRWRALAGYNYYYQEQDGNIDGGVGVFSNLFGFTQIGPGATVVSNEITTHGIFGAFEYDILDNLTLAVEGRWQEDELIGISGPYPGPYTRSEPLKYTDFLPRFVATYRPMEGASMYLSYSEGTQPGIVNNVIATLDAAELAAAQALVPELSDRIDSETLESWEIGWKQQFADGRAFVSLSAYDMTWKNTKGFTQLTFASPTDGRIITTSAFIPGEVEVQGVEIEAKWSPVEQLDLHATYGYIKSEYVDYPNSSLNALLGVPAGSVFQAQGNQLPRSPKESASLAASWTDELTAGWSYHIRGDLSYFGKAYTDESNLAWIKAYSLLNVRMGVRNGEGLGLELFCSNCADEGGWMTGRRLIDFGDTSPAPNFFNNQGAIVQPLKRREIGVRVQYDF